MEPTEGQSSTSSRVDWLLADARANNLRLVLLWFGTWKNSISSYAPVWVKRDPARFPRISGEGGGAGDHLRAFAPRARDADARAFAALMAPPQGKSTRKHDAVIMVQVENEIGFTPRSRREAWPRRRRRLCSR